RPILSLGARPPPPPPPSPYTTLFRSRAQLHPLGPSRNSGEKFGRTEHRLIRLRLRGGTSGVFTLLSQGVEEVVLNPQMREPHPLDRKSTRLNSSHVKISYAVFCLKKK